MAAGADPGALASLKFTIGRLSDNELIFFDEAARESWIIYPPRSRYTHLRRPSGDTTMVEHHPWAPLSASLFHVVTAAEGCAEHGVECGAYTAVKAAAEAGWNAFA